MKTEIISDNIPAAAEIIKAGGLVSVPTETVYGLAASGFDAEAVERIYEVKGRPENKPLSLMVSGVEAMDELCEEVPPAARFLAEVFWPGPLTIVLKAKKGLIPDIVLSGGDTVGLRCPDNAKTLELIKAAGLPLAAPSANPSGEKSPTSAKQVLDYFDGKIDAIIDGGECEKGDASTIIDMAHVPYKILREGALPEAQINMALNASLTIIGITGGTGCGKTTALDIISDMGGLIIDCDEVYHDLLIGNEDMRAEINARFPGALTPGSDDTKALGEIVFNDPAALRELNGITHRYVGMETNRRLNLWARNGMTLAAIDAIALIESGVGNSCRATVGITAPTEARIKRLMQREDISEEYARLRIDAQKPNEFFEKACDYCLSNDSTREEFAKKCKELFNNIIRR